MDAVVCATGYRLDLPYLDPALRDLLVAGDELDLYQRTLHPDLPGLGVVGQFLLQGPYWPLLELQARWIVGSLVGTVPLPDDRPRCGRRWSPRDLGWSPTTCWGCSSRRSRA